MRRPLAAFAASFALGALLEAAGAAGRAVTISILLIASLYIILAAFFHRSSILLVLLLTAGALLGSWRFQQTSNPGSDNVARLAPSLITVMGAAQDDAVPPLHPQASNLPVTARLSIRAQKVKISSGGWLSVSGNITVYLRLNPNTPVSSLPQYGDEVIARGELDHPEVLRDPGQIGCSNSLVTHPLPLVLYTRTPLEWRLIHPPVQANPIVWLSMFIRRIVSAHFRQSLSPDSAALMEALLLGIRRDLSPKIQEALTRTGTLHLFAGAGLQIGMLAFFLPSMFRRMRIPRRGSRVAAILLILIYAIPSAGRPSIDRAVTLSILWLLAPIMGRLADFTAGIAAAALILFWNDPLSFMRPGFQLTFIVVISIVLLLPFSEGLSARLSKRAARVHPWLEPVVRSLVELIFLTLAAETALLPLLAFYFHQFSLISFIASPLMALLAVPALLIGYPAGILGALAPPIAVPLDRILSGLLGLMIRLIESLSHPLWAAITVPAPPLFLLVLYYAFLWGSAALLHSKHKLPAWSVQEAYPPAFAALLPVFTLISLCIPLGLSLLVVNHSNMLRIYFLDVGQGDAAVIQTPSNNFYLIDTGGIMKNTGDNMGRKVVSPFLRWDDAERVNAILLTHPHADHIGGAAAIIEEFPVGMVADNGQNFGSPEETDYLEAAQQEHVPVEAAHIGEDINLGNGIDLSLFAPNAQEEAGTANNASLVARITYGRTAFLMMGDAEAPEEEMLLRSGEPLGCDVLKVGHHGSHTSTTDSFLQAAHPSIAIISVGAHNIYGHPSPDVVSRLKAAGITVYRTDQDGAVLCSSDGVVVHAERLCHQ